MFPAHQRSSSTPKPTDSVLTRFSPLSDPTPSITPQQYQVDHLVHHFISQASDWKTLTSLTAGGLAYRWGKISTLNVGAIRESPLLARPLSIALGLGSEVTAFEFTHRTLSTLSLEGEGRGEGGPANHWSWSGPGGWKEGWLHSFVAFGTIKGLGRLAREQNIVLQHGFQDTGMVLGHQLVYHAGIGPRPEGGLADQFLNAEITNLQVGVGMGLGHALTGGRILAVERGLDLLQRGGDWITPLSQRGARGDFAFATAGETTKRSPFLPEAEPRSPFLNRPMQMVKKGDGGSKAPETRSAKEKAELKEKLERIYGKDLLKVLENPLLVQETLEAALEIPPRLEKGPKNLLTALIHFKEKDPQKTHLTALGVKEIFNRDALYTSRGSYQDAVVQLFLESALSDPDPARRVPALRYLHQALKKGIEVRDLEEHMEHFGYGLDYGLSAEGLQRFHEEVTAIEPPQDKLKLYPKPLLTRALEYALETRFPRLVVKRIVNVVHSGAHPSKLAELRRFPSNDRGAEISRLLDSVSLDVLSRKINGTHHTAFVEDVNLARRVALIRRTEYQWRVLEPNKILESRQVLEVALSGFINSMGSAGLPFTPNRFIELLQCNSQRLAQKEDIAGAVARDFEGKKFELSLVTTKQFVSDPAFDSHRSPFSLTRGNSSTSRRSQILIRELPELDLETEKGRWEAFSALNSRLSALVFEWTMLHYASSPPLVARMIAHLETQRWRLMNGLPMEWELADRFGGMVPYLRGWVEHP